MKAIILLLLVVIVTGCRKYPSQSDNSSVNTTDSSEAEKPVSFSFSEAVVSEKKGRSDEVSEVVQILKENALLSSTVADSIQYLTNQNLLESNFDIARHMSKAIVFRTDTLSETFPYFYNTLIDTLLKQAGQTNYVVNITPIQPEAGDKNVATAVIEIFQSTQIFTQEIRLDSGLGTVDENFYKVVNLLLSTQNQSERYYLVRKIMEYEYENTFYYGTDNKEYALVQLSKQVALFIQSFPNVINLSVEDHRQPLSHEALKSMIVFLDSAKLYPSGADTAKEYSRLKKETLYDVRDVFFHSPVLRKCFSPFSSHFDQSYTDILNTLKEHSNLTGSTAFTSHQVIPVSNKETEISINVNNNVYTSTLENGYDRINIEELLQLINTALNKELIDGNFYLLNNKTSDYCYIFMTGEQVDLVNQLLKY